MEQTLLPDGVSNSNYFLRNKLINPLTSHDFRVMNTIVNKKEADNANRKQKLKTRGQTHRSIPQTELFLRSGGECGGKTALPTGGRPGIQESIGCRNGHHRTCLRRLGVLGYGNGRDAAAPNAENQEVVTAAEIERKEEPAAEPASTAAKADPRKTGVFLVPNQKGVPEGQIRWFCRDCGKSFITSAVEIPGICPTKHQTK